MPRFAPTIALLPRQRAVLEHLVRSSTTEYRVVERARIVLLSAGGMLCIDQAEVLGVDAQRVRRWRRRWSASQEMLYSAEAQEVSTEELGRLVLDALLDEPHTGMKPRFTAQQVALIIGLACQEPDTLGLPITHWTPRELVAEAKKRKIVVDISPRHLARFLKGGGHPAAQVALLAQSQDRGPCATRGTGTAGL